jgi:hypothetical protein
MSWAKAPLTASRASAASDAINLDFIIFGPV